jgi:formate dehydrogenase subunit delta
MDSHHMVHMANSIALNFSAYPREEAIKLTKQHLQDFWEPRMRRQLHAYVAEGGSGLNELALEAEKLLKK